MELKNEERFAGKADIYKQYRRKEVETLYYRRQYDV